MKRPIKYTNSAVLRKKAKPVTKALFGSEKLVKLIEEMSDTLKSTSDGIGLAAPQIGVSLRVFIASEEALAIDAGKQKSPDEQQQNTKWAYYVFINPEIIKKSKERSSATEGCLSVPGKYGKVERSVKIRVHAYDEYGKPFERGATKLFSRLLQHEIDHLNGILYIDKAKDMVDIDQS